jgi:hypothetical protein
MVASKIAFVTLLASLAVAAPTPQIGAQLTTPRGYPAGVVTLGPGSSAMSSWPNNPAPRNWNGQWDRPYPYNNQPWRDYDDRWDGYRGQRDDRDWRGGSPIVITTTPGVTSSLDISK